VAGRRRQSERVLQVLAQADRVSNPSAGRDMPYRYSANKINRFLRCPAAASGRASFQWSHHSSDHVSFRPARSAVMCQPQDPVR